MENFKCALFSGKVEAKPTLLEGKKLMYQNSVANMPIVQPNHSLSRNTCRETLIKKKRANAQGTHAKIFNDVTEIS